MERLNLVPTILRIALFTVCLQLFAATGVAQRIKAKDLAGKWEGSDGMTYLIRVEDNESIEIKVSGDDAKPKVVPTFSPLQITATGAEMMNGLVYKGTFDLVGFEVKAKIGGPEGFNFYPKAVPDAVGVLLLAQKPDFSSSLSFTRLSFERVLLNRNLTRLAWRGKNPTILVEVNETAEVREINLTRRICIFETFGIEGGKDTTRLRDPVKYAVRHIETIVTAVNRDGEISQEQPIIIVHRVRKKQKDKPDKIIRQKLSPEWQKLFNQIIKANGQTLDDMLELDQNKKDGDTVQTFGCEAGCKCIPFPDPLLPNRLDPIPDEEKFKRTPIQGGKVEPLVAFVKRLVNISDRGEFIVKFKIEYRGKYRKQRGYCVPE